MVMPSRVRSCLGAVECLQRLHRAEFLRHAFRTALPPQAGGVDDGVGAAVTLEVGVDAVAGGAGQIVGDHPFLAEDTVDEGRLADVGPTDHGDAGAAVVGRRVLRGVRPVACEMLDERGDAVAMRGGYREHRLDAETPELGGDDGAVLAFHLVHRQRQCHAGSTQLGGELLVGRVQSGAAVDDEDGRIAVAGHRQRLRGNAAGEHVVTGLVDAAGVDDDVAGFAHAADADLGIAGQPRHVGDQGRARTRDAVEQGRLADVGPADDGQGGAPRRRGGGHASRGPRWPDS
jgi:hypothetical protein